MIVCKCGRRMEARGGNLIAFQFQSIAFIAPWLTILSDFFSFQFVSHPNVQQLLASIWYEGLPGFRRKNMALQSLEICRIGKWKSNFGSLNFFIPLITGIMFPLFSVAYVFTPHSRFGQTMRKPFIKFICHSASYFTFLCEYYQFMYMQKEMIFG